MKKKIKELCNDREKAKDLLRVRGERGRVIKKELDGYAPTIWENIKNELNNDTLNVVTLALILKWVNPTGYYVPRKETRKEFYNRLGLKKYMHFKTFDKYFSKLIEGGYTRTVSRKGTIQLESLYTILRLSGMDIKLDYFNQFFRVFKNKKLKFTAIKKTVIETIVMLHFKQQEYKIAQKADLREIASKVSRDGINSHKVNLRAYKKFKKLSGNKTKGWLYNFAQKFMETNSPSIIGGCISIAQKVGVSHNYMNGIINGLSKKEFVIRDIQIHRINHTAYNHYKHTFFDSKRKCFSIIGSVFTIREKFETLLLEEKVKAQKIPFVYFPIFPNSPNSSISGAW